MRILAVRARAFGPLRDRELVLRPGMNVIHGANEAGKSSWHAAIFAGLCGMRRVRGGRTREEKAFIERHRPWNGDDWSVELDVELTDGRRIQIMQDLDDPAASRVIDLQTGGDITGELIRDGAPDGSSLLGLTRETLPETICIRQAEVLRVLENTKELQVQIQQAAATGGRDHTAEAAIERIRAFKRNEVGLRRTSSTRPLQAALDRVESVSREAAEARTAHEEYLSLMEAKELAAAEASRHGDELRAARRTVALKRVEALTAKVDRARELGARFPEGEPPDPAESVTLQSAVREAVAAFSVTPHEPERSEGPSSEAIEAEIEALPEHPEGDLEPAAEVSAAIERWRAGRQQVEILDETEPAISPRPDVGGLSVSELRSLADRLETPLPPVEGGAEGSSAGSGAGPFPWRTALLTGGAGLAVVGSSIAALAPGMLGVGLTGVVVGVAAVVVAALWRGRGRARPHEHEARLAVQRAAAEQAAEALRGAQARLSAAGLPADAAVLRRVAGELEDHESARRSRERWSERAERARDAERRAARDLRDAVESRGIANDPAADVEELVSRYRAECEARALQARLAARRELLVQALTAQRAAEDAAAADRRQRHDAEQRLREVASRAGVTPGDPADTVEALRQVEARLERDIAQWQRDREDWAALVEIRAGRSLADLERELDRLERDVPAPGPADGATPDLGAEPERRVRELEHHHANARGHLDRLLGQIDASERDLPDVAAAEEAEQQARREQQRVETLDHTLERTLEFLEQARDRVQRDIAPRLGASVRERLSTVTAGRYEEVLVDPGDLEVRVRVPGGDWVSATSLSHGTTEQIYLLVRLALAEHLVTTGEPAPLVLDDVTVQSDATRTMAFLDVLHGISGERQIILFSQEQEVVAWARAALDESRDRRIELSAAPFPVSGSQETLENR